MALLEKLDPGRVRDAEELAIRTGLMGALISAGPSIVAGDRIHLLERLKDLCEQAGETQNLASVLTLYIFSIDRRLVEKKPPNLLAQH